MRLWIDKDQITWMYNVFDGSRYVQTHDVSGFKLKSQSICLLIKKNRINLFRVKTTHRIQIKTKNKVRISKS